MIANHPFGACLPTFGNCADRYCLSGYGGGGSTMREMLDLAMKVEGLDGLELVGNWHVNDENIRDVARMFADRGLKISMLVPICGLRRNGAEAAWPRRMPRLARQQLTRSAK